MSCAASTHCILRLSEFVELSLVDSRCCASFRLVTRVATTAFPRSTRPEGPASEAASRHFRPSACLWRRRPGECTVHGPRPGVVAFREWKRCYGATHQNAPPFRSRIDLLRPLFAVPATVLGHSPTPNSLSPNHFQSPRSHLRWYLSFSVSTCHQWP